MPLSEESDPFARRQVPEQRRRLRSSLKFSWFKSPFAFQVCPGGLPGQWGGAALSGAALLGYPLDYHPRSVVNWLTRWTFGNSSCKPVTCSVGGGLFLCPLFEQFRPNPPLDGFGELEKICAHVSVLLSAYSQPLRLVVRLACCVCMVAPLRVSVKRSTVLSTFCTKSTVEDCEKYTVECREPFGII